MPAGELVGGDVDVESDFVVGEGIVWDCKGWREGEGGAERCRGPAAIWLS